MIYIYQTLYFRTLSYSFILEIPKYPNQQPPPRQSHQSRRTSGHSEMQSYDSLWTQGYDWYLCRPILPNIVMYFDTWNFQIPLLTASMQPFPSIWTGSRSLWDAKFWFITVIYRSWFIYTKSYTSEHGDIFWYLEIPDAHASSFHIVCFINIEGH